MSAQPAPSSQNNLVVYLLGAIVVLLVVIVAFVVMRGQAATSPTTAATAGQTAAGTSNPGVGSSTAAAFDAATATKVTAGSTPEQFVKQYYQNILDKKWDAAFKMQPAASQTGSVAEFQNTQETMYGMTKFTVDAGKTSGNTDVVSATLILGSNGEWKTVWTFQKYNGGWVVQNRQVSMGQ